MPYTNKIKNYKENNVYHLYARGINKMDIFKDVDDYRFFIYLLKKYLTENFKEKKLIQGEEMYIPVNSVYGLVELQAYALMPNHFHILLKNVDGKGITMLMQRIMPQYTAFFNNKHKRQGPLIHGGTRAVRILNDNVHFHVLRYIHLNPLKAKLIKKPIDYEYSSYKNYLYNKSNSFVTVKEHLQRSTDWENIDKYAKDYKDYEESMKII